MRLLTLKDISAMEPGEIVPGFRAQIKDAGKYSTGTNTYGAFTVQKLTVLDSTGILTVKVWDRPEYTKDWQGVWIVAESTPSDKGGKLRGLMIVNDTYREKTTKQLHIKEGATISQATDSAPPAEATPVQPAKMPPPAQVQQPPTQQAAPKTNGQHTNGVMTQDDWDNLFYLLGYVELATRSEADKPRREWIKHQAVLLKEKMISLEQTISGKQQTTKEI